jgi:5-methylcytosine-specific restriction endonuclease McrA
MPPAPKPCTVCDNPTISPRYRYCARCRRWCAVRKEIRARVKTLRENFDRKNNCFRCSYCGAILDEKNNKSPLFLCFDHPTPRKRNDLAVCSSIMNYMKSDMLPEEFRPVVIALAHRFLHGARFDISLTRFRYWKRVARARLRRTGRLEKRWDTEECILCGKVPVPHTRYCARCHKLADAPDFSMVQLEALIDAYDRDLDAFICHYTGLPLDLTDPGSPLYLNFDHVIPRDNRRLVCAASFVNVMKSEMTEDEFRAVIIELAHHWETGEPFDTNVLKLKYWTGLSRTAG